ncbi:hypothetical protein EDD22DRAFT_926614, partial [Suillus occidentalis]
NHLPLRLLHFGVISTHTHSTPFISPTRRNRSLTLHDRNTTPSPVSRCTTNPVLRQIPSLPYAIDLLACMGRYVTVPPMVDISLLPGDQSFSWLILMS